MGLATRFEDLQVWQEARRLTAQVYAIADARSFRRDYGLADQVRRAAVSTMNNIAEGFDSASRVEFRRFLRYTARSASEVQSCLYVALDQRYLEEGGFRALYDQAERVRRMCRSFSKSLEGGRKRSARPGEVKDAPSGWRDDWQPTWGISAPEARASLDSSADVDVLASQRENAQTRSRANALTRKRAHALTRSRSPR